MTSERAATLERRCLRDHSTFYLSFRFTFALQATLFFGNVSSLGLAPRCYICIQCIHERDRYTVYPVYPGAGLHTPATPLDAAPPPRSAGAPPPHPAHAHPRTRHYLHRTPTSPGAGSGAGDGDGASAEDEERDARSGLGFIARGFVTDDRYIDR